jgi:hypothetical protein
MFEKLQISLIFPKKDMWMEKNKELGTPLSQWYSRYKTMREREILMEISNKDLVSFWHKLQNKKHVNGVVNLVKRFKISQNRVPVVEKPSQEQKDEEKREFNELFVNASEDESDSELFDFMPKKKVSIFSTFWNY